MPESGPPRNTLPSGMDKPPYAPWCFGPLDMIRVQRASLTLPFVSAVDLPETTKTALATLLQPLLAAHISLWALTKTAHWNLKGPQFAPLHALFDNVAEHLEDAADTIAERIVQLGGVASGTISVVADAGSSTTATPVSPSGLTFVRLLVEQLAGGASSVRAGVVRSDELGDRATSDMLSSILQVAEKDLWFLQAHLQG